MQIKLRTNLDLSNANRFSLSKTEDLMNRDGVVPRVGDDVILHRGILRVCAVRFNSSKVNPMAYAEKILVCEVELTVPQHLSINDFQRLQGGM